MTRKVCVVTGGRAEYGLLRWLMTAIRETPGLQLQVVATGMHLSPEFGLTFREIEADGFPIDDKVEMLLSSDTPGGVTKSMGLGLIGFADTFRRLQPDLVVVLGDRFEILSVASAALIARIPLAHLHGGETTEGAFDEAIRHAITKMAHLHFVAAEEYERRVVQLGEDPSRVFVVGGLGIDNIHKLALLARAELEEALDFKLGAKNLLITYHPVTLDGAESSHHMQALLEALDTLQDTHLIFTMPNADSDGRALGEMVQDYAAKRPNARVYKSLGQLRYLSCMKHVDGVVGNSSSGLIEAPALGKGTVNIGDRQRGRLKAASVIDSAPNREAIVAALQRLLTPAFQSEARAVRNPYGDGGAAARIVGVLRDFPLDDILKKRFYDLAFDASPRSHGRTS